MQLEAAGLAAAPFLWVATLIPFGMGDLRKCPYPEAGIWKPEYKIPQRRSERFSSMPAEADTFFETGILGPADILSAPEVMPDEGIGGFESEPQANRSVLDMLRSCDQFITWGLYLCDF